MENYCLTDYSSRPECPLASSRSSAPRRLAKEVFSKKALRIIKRFAHGIGKNNCRWAE